MGFRKIPLNEFLAGQYERTFRQNDPAVHPDLWKPYNPNSDYGAATGDYAGAGGQNQQAWMAQRVLGGQTPEAYFDQYNRSLGIDPATFTDWRIGGARLDPETGMVIQSDEMGGDPYGNAVMGGTLGFFGGVGALGNPFSFGGAEGSGFGNPEAFNLVEQTGSNLTGGSSALGGNSGGGMWDWLDEIINSGGPDVGAENMFNFEGGQELLRDLSTLPPATNMQDLITKLDSTPAGKTLLNSLIGGGSDAAGAGGLSLSGLSNLTKLLGIGGGSGSTGKGIWDQITNDPLNAAFNATPFLLALQQANSQSKDLDSVMSKINGEAYANSVLNPYDMDTSKGRTALTDSLSQRGVLGSSFGDQSLNSYDYTRALGRGDLFNRANVATAGLEGQLINQRNTNKNLLLGAGLNASGQLFSPKKDPFGLDYLRALGVA